MLTQEDKKDIGKIVVEILEDVVMPAFELVYEKFETVATKKDLKAVEIRLGGVEGRIETVESRLNSVEMKLDRVVDNQLEEQGKLKDYEKRIKKLESTIATS